MKKDRVSVLLDGGNFYHLVLKKMGFYELQFSYDDFIKFLSGDREIANLGKRYYVGTIREVEGDPRSKMAMSRQTKLLTILKQNGWQLKTSKLRLRTEELIIDSRVENYQILKRQGINKILYTRNREKGIDVKLATDLIMGAVDDQYDTAIVISSDTDLIPAIDCVRNRFKKKVEYIGFSIQDKNDSDKNTRPLSAMITHSDSQRIFIEKDIAKFIHNT